MTAFGSSNAPPVDPSTRALGSTARPRSAPRGRSVGQALAGLLLASCLGAGVADAQHTLAIAAHDPGVDRMTVSRTADDRWRARGMAFVDLPLGLRARYEAQALHRLPPRQDLGTPFVEHPDGATRRSTRLLESRFALSRVLAPHLELELAWAARSPLSMVDLLRIEDQRLAAMIRFVP